MYTVLTSQVAPYFLMFATHHFQLLCSSFRAKITEKNGTGIFGVGFFFGNYHQKQIPLGCPKKLVKRLVTGL